MAISTVHNATDISQPAREREREREGERGLELSCFFKKGNFTLTLISPYRLRLASALLTIVVATCLSVATTVAGQAVTRGTRIISQMKKRRHKECSEYLGLTLLVP